MCGTESHEACARSRGDSFHSDDGARAVRDCWRRQGHVGRGAAGHNGRGVEQCFDFRIRRVSKATMTSRRARLSSTTCSGRGRPRSSSTSGSTSKRPSTPTATTANCCPSRGFRGRSIGRGPTRTPTSRLTAICRTTRSRTGGPLAATSAALSTTRISAAARRSSPTIRRS